MREICGKIKRYFEAEESIGMLPDSGLLIELLNSSRGLVYPYVCNTYYYKGSLRLSFLFEHDLHTIVNRRNHGKRPYKISELADDIKNHRLDRAEVNLETEENIIGIKETMSHLRSNNNLPIIIEDNIGKNYLVLDGNKRLTAFYLRGNNLEINKIGVYLAKTDLSWKQILINHEMLI